MKKIGLILIFVITILLSGCISSVEVTCGEGTVDVDGTCVPESSITCEVGYTKIDGECVKDELECSTGYHEEDGACVKDDLECNTGYHEENGVCVIDVVVEFPDWFDGWSLLQEPIGNMSLNDYVFTDDGFSVTLSPDQRTGIQMLNYVLEPGYSYEVRLEYSSTAPGRMIFVQLQGHGGYAFTSPAVQTSDTVQQFSETLAFSPEANYTENGWLTIELLPGGESGTITISNIEVIKTALPTCAENEELDGLVCVPSNNGYIPNGTPTAWFDGWQILTVPAGDKEIEDLDFTETGYTVYLGEGDRSGIELLDYVFESGYSYELRFDYTASVAGRMVWVQMEALGGYGFTNTDTWTINGTGTFSQTLEIPSTYTPVEPGWIKLELAPGAMDNVTIDNIQIIKTPIT